MSLNSTTQGTEVTAGTHTSDSWVYSIDTNTPTPTKSISFSTKDKYAHKNIKFQINIPGVVIPTPSSGTSSFYITIGGITYTWKIDSSGNVWVE